MIQINTSIKAKLISLFLLIGLIPFGVIGFVSLNTAKKALKEKAVNQLVSLRDSRKSQIEAYLNERLSDVSGLSTSPSIAQALEAFDRAFDMGPYSARYKKVDKKYSDWLNQYERENGYYDFLLISAIGDILYTVEKRSDFATDVIEGKFSGENIADLFKLAESGIAMVDFAPYTPSDSAPAAFVGAPIMDETGFVIGEVVLQLPMDQINRIMQESNGLGQSAETFLVGTDHLMRSDSRFSTKSTVLEKVIETSTVVEGLGGKTGVDIISGYRGEEVLSAYAPITVGGMNWCILAEIDTDEAFAAISFLQTQMLIIGLIMLFIVVVIGLLFARTISRPIAQIANIAEQISTGDIKQTIDIKSEDETGMLAASFRRLIDYIQDLERVAMSIAKNDLTVDVVVKSQRDALGQSFKSMVASLSAMINKLGDNASDLSSAAGKISLSSDNLSRGALKQSGQMEEISSAIEEISATLVESSRNANDASETSQLAADTATHGGGIVRNTITSMKRISDVVNQSSQGIDNLASTVDEIDEIVSVINEIADQTNLLALNAAIEAARAGEKGRGFAVVADEVRKLAERTGAATGEIGKMIAAIHSNTSKVVDSMQSGIKEVETGVKLADQAGDSLNEIIDVSQRVMDIVQRITIASQEQSSAAAQISKNISEVTSITGETASSAEQSAVAANSLNCQAEELRATVEQFKVNP